MPSDDSAKSVLIVDDDPLQVSILDLYFSANGYVDVATAQNGRVALERIAARRQPFDIVVSDLKMPEMDGLAFMRALKDRGFAGDLLIISSASQRLIDSARKLSRMHGFRSTGVLKKPLTRAALDEAIAKLSAPETIETPGYNDLSVEELRRIISGDRMTVVYQPKVEVWTGRIVGVEALARIAGALEGTVSPSVFVPLAEASDLISPMTLNVIAKALQDMKSWSEAGCNVRMAFNVSALSLHDTGFTKDLLRIIEAAGVVKNMITCELTESNALDATPEVLESLTRIAMNRMGISVDDFGTGFASMERLRDFAYTELKIDRSFAANAHHDAFADASVRASVVLGRNLGMRIVAEGIETPEQLDYIVKAGVDEIQGYVFGSPMRSADFLAWYHSHGGTLTLEAA